MVEFCNFLSLAIERPVTTIVMIIAVILVMCGIESCGCRMKMNVESNPNVEDRDPVEDAGESAAKGARRFGKGFVKGLVTDE